MSSLKKIKKDKNVMNYLKKGGVLNLTLHNLNSRDPGCNSRECTKINRYINELFRAYYLDFDENIPSDNVWHNTPNTGIETIYTSFKIQNQPDGRKVRRVIIKYRDFLYIGGDYNELLHLSFNENGSMHLTFDNVEIVGHTGNLHIFSNINPDINDGLNDLIEFVSYIRYNIFNNNDTLRNLVSYSLNNPNSAWHAYIRTEIERTQREYPGIRLDIPHTVEILLNRFREKYIEILTRFILALYNNRNTFVLGQINNNYRQLTNSYIR